MAYIVPEKKPSQFGKIAPIVGSVAGGVGGAIVGGPMGAAAGMSAGGALGKGAASLEEGDKVGAVGDALSAAQSMAGGMSKAPASGGDALSRRLQRNLSMQKINSWETE